MTLADSTKAVNELYRSRGFVAYQTMASTLFRACNGRGYKRNIVDDPWRYVVLSVLAIGFRRRISLQSTDGSWTCVSS